MSKQKILDGIIGCVSMFTDVPKEQIKEQSHLTNDLDLDSLSLMMLIDSLEEKFEISLDEGVFLSVPTIDRIGKYIEKRLKD